MKTNKARAPRASNSNIHMPAGYRRSHSRRVMSALALGLMALLMACGTATRSPVNQTPAPTEAQNDTRQARAALESAASKLGLAVGTVDGTVGVSCAVTQAEWPTDPYGPFASHRCICVRMQRLALSPSCAHHWPVALACRPGGRLALRRVCPWVGTAPPIWPNLTSVPPFCRSTRRVGPGSVGRPAG